MTFWNAVAKLKGGPEPLENEINETNFPTLFLNWYKKHVRLVFCTCFGTVIYLRSSRFEPNITLISFSRGSGPPQSFETAFENVTPCWIDYPYCDIFEISNPFFEVVQKACQVRFPYLFQHGHLLKSLRTLRKFPQKCQKIAGCRECAVYGSRPVRFETWLIPSRTTQSGQYHESTMV